MPDGNQLPAIPVTDASATALPDLYEATIEELAAGLEQGDFTSVDLVEVRDLALCL